MHPCYHGYVTLSAKMQTCNDGNGILHCLCCSITRNGYECVRTVFDLNDAVTGRGPAGLWISSYSLSVDNVVFGNRFDKRGHMFASFRQFVHGFKDLLIRDEVLP